MPLYLFTLSPSSSLFFQPNPPPLPSTPLLQRGVITTLYTATADKKIRRVTLANHLSPPLPFSYSLSLPLYLFSLSLSRSSSLFLFFHPHPNPYISLISTLYLSIFSLFLVLLLSFFNPNLRSYGQLFVLVLSYDIESILTVSMIKYRLNDKLHIIINIRCIIS